MSASLWLKVELLTTVAAVVGVGVLVQLGLLNREYAGIAIGMATGSGIRSVVGSATVPPAKDSGSETPAG